MIDVIATAQSGAVENDGVHNNNSTPTMTNVTARAFSGGPNANDYGVFNQNSSPQIRDSNISASGGLDNAGLVRSGGGGTVTIDNSRIAGVNHTIVNNTGGTTRAGASQLSGGAVSNSGTLTCAGVYDENYVFFPNTCP
jgi:hypothetical protein